MFPYYFHNIVGPLRCQYVPPSTAQLLQVPASHFLRGDGRTKWTPEDSSSTASPFAASHRMEDAKLSGSLLPGWHYIKIWMKFMVSRSTRPALVEVLKRPLAGRTEMKFLGRRKVNTLYRWPRKTTCPMPPREWGFRVGTGCLLVRQKNILTWASQVLLWGCLPKLPTN